MGDFVYCSYAKCSNTWCGRHHTNMPTGRLVDLKDFHEDTACPKIQGGIPPVYKGDDIAAELERLRAIECKYNELVAELELHKSLP